MMDDDSSPFVSVVVPTRDRAVLLADALGSLLAQHYPKDRYEIVVVDDGSTDGSADIARALASPNYLPKISVLQQQPKNANAARNQGIRHAAASLIAFLDDDELAPPGWLSALVDGSLRYPLAACFGGPYWMKFDDPPPRMCMQCWPGEWAFDAGSSDKSVMWVSGGNMLIRREAIDLIGLFDESLRGWGDEHEWMTRLGRAGGTVIYLPKAHVWHRRSGADMRLPRRLRTCFVNGRRIVRYQRRSGQHLQARTTVQKVPRYLAHAVRRRCTRGLASAAYSLGYLTESLAPRTEGEDRIQDGGS